MTLTKEEREKVEQIWTDLQSLRPNIVRLIETEQKYKKLVELIKNLIEEAKKPQENHQFEWELKLQSLLDEVEK